MQVPATIQGRKEKDWEGKKKERREREPWGRARPLLAQASVHPKGRRGAPPMRIAVQVEARRKSGRRRPAALSG